MKKEKRLTEKHCSSCGGAVEGGLQEVCSCPCHTHPDRICVCGEVRDIIEQRAGVKLNLKGEQSPYMVIIHAQCKECGREWRKKKK